MGKNSQNTEKLYLPSSHPCLSFLPIFAHFLAISAPIPRFRN